TDQILLATHEADATFKLLDPTTATLTPLTTISGLSGDVKVATVRASACLGGFTAGDVYAGNGQPGGLLKISGGVPQNPWVTLPGESGLVSGLYQDHVCAVGGDLVVVTSAGGIWRVTAAGTASL